MENLGRNDNEDKEEDKEEDCAENCNDAAKAPKKHHPLKTTLLKLPMEWRRHGYVISSI